MEAFARYYTFSPAYFVFRSDPNAIFQLQEDSVGRRLQAASPSEEVVFLAEFGTAYDTPLLLEDESGTRPAGGVGGLPGLVVKDLRGIQLEDPFPYRVNTNYRPTNRGRAVQILNDRLWAYYSQVQRKSQRRSKLGRE